MNKDLPLNPGNEKKLSELRSKEELQNNEANSIDIKFLQDQLKAMADLKAKVANLFHLEHGVNRSF